MTAKEATEKRNITYYEDGAYAVTTILYGKSGDGASAQTAASETDGAKKADYYDSFHELLWTFYVYGTFTYDGRNAKATNASYSYKIYNSNWTFECGNAYCSGATATATATFKSNGRSHYATVSLTCSATGQLS